MSHQRPLAHGPWDASHSSGCRPAILLSQHDCPLTSRTSSFFRLDGRSLSERVLLHVGWHPRSRPAIHLLSESSMVRDRGGGVPAFPVRHACCRRMGRGLHMAAHLAEHACRDGLVLLLAHLALLPRVGPAPVQCKSCWTLQEQVPPHHHVASCPLPHSRALKNLVVASKGSFTTCGTASWECWFGLPTRSALSISSPPAGSVHHPQLRVQGRQCT